MECCGVDWIPLVFVDCWYIALDNFSQFYLPNKTIRSVNYFSLMFYNIVLNEVSYTPIHWNINLNTHNKYVFASLNVFENSNLTFENYLELNTIFMSFKKN